MSKPIILCVDDEPFVLESLEIELKRAFGENYDYEFAESAEEALEVIQDLSEDNVEVLVIISDWLMPGMKGDELLIRIHQKMPTVIKIMLTGQADEEAVERAQSEAHLQHCLRKPWDSQELIETIKTSLANHE